MIALLLIACELSPLPTAPTDRADTATTETPDSADPTTSEIPIAACLADGGGLVERSASSAWTAGLTDLEVARDGAIYALTGDGHLLLADPDDLGAWADLGSMGSSSDTQGMIDLADEQLLVSVGGVKVGATSEDPGSWTTVTEASGDGAVSPDGATVAYSVRACGVSWGVIDVASGDWIELDPAADDQTLLDFEFLDDGRLAAMTLTDDWTGGLAIFDGQTLEAAWSFEGEAQWLGALETLGDDVAMPTAGDGTQGTLERVDLGTGAHSSVTLPFPYSAAVALDDDLVWALSSEGELVASDGASLYELGAWSGVTDLVADPQGRWLATSSEDGILRLYGCE